ncbi:hypothetical protein EDB84DRAFT_1272704 [Lactarius hengduanensis]|nr:hypothetical protein EDB84DRAFT_1272704 [Lactarius hengduanensis]
MIKYFLTCFCIAHTISNSQSSLSTSLNVPNSIFIDYGHCNISDKDLPHCTKLTELVFAAYEEEHQHLKVCYQKSLSRVSFSSDLWSDPNLVSFMALTSHFLSRDSSGPPPLRQPTPRISSC